MGKKRRQPRDRYGNLFGKPPGSIRADAARVEAHGLRWDGRLVPLADRGRAQREALGERGRLERNMSVERLADPMLPRKRRMDALVEKVRTTPNLTPKSAVQWLGMEFGLSNGTAKQMIEDLLSFKRLAVTQDGVLQEGPGL